MARGSWKGLGLQRGPEFSFKPATHPPPSLQPPAPGSAGVPPPPLGARTRSRLPRCGTPARPQRRTRGLGPVTHLRPRDTHPPLAARGRQQGAAEPRRGRAAGRSPHLTCAPGQRRPPPKKTQKPKPFALLCSALPTRTRTHRAGGDERSGGALSTEPPDSGLQGPPPPPPSSARAGLGDSSPVPGAGRPGTPFTAAPCKWPLGSAPAPAATAPPGSCERPGPRGSSRSAAAAAA